MLDVAILEELHFLRTADTASKREHAALSRVLVRRWVGNAERAVDAVAVVERHLILVIHIMAALAHVVRAEAAEEGDAAAELALPVDLLGAVLLALGLTSSNRLEQAFLAEKVLLLGLLLLGVGHLLFAVDEAAEVGLLAVVALVERAPVVRVLLRLPKVSVRLVAKAFVLKQALLFGIFERLLFHLLFEAEERFELVNDLAAHVITDE